MSLKHWLIGLVMLTLVGAAAGQEPAGQVELKPARWRAVRPIIQTASDQTGFRWAMPAPISRRAFVGATEPIATKALLQDTCKQTGLTLETIAGIQVFHIPRNEERQRLVAQLGDSDRKKKLQALVELGWLPDARAWPELAKIAAGQDVELALAAAQALRRLDGEKGLDWRLWGTSDSDPELVDMSEAAPAWQVPLCRAFPEAVTPADVERLARSPYIPLREAAARLAASLGSKGKGVVDKLINDPSPIVQAAAKRTLPAWAELAKSPPRVRKNTGEKPWHEQPLPDLKEAAQKLADSKDHDTIWRLTGRRLAYHGSADTIQVLITYGNSGAKWSKMASRPLAEFCGGPAVIDYLKKEAANEPTWALWGLYALQDGKELAESLRPLLDKGKPYWSAPPEFTAATGAGIHALPLLLPRLEKRGHWVCLALGHIGGPQAVDTLVANLSNADPGVAVAAAKGLGDTAALAGIDALIAQLKHEDRLRRHWAVLGLGRIGGPEAAKALTDLLQAERRRKDRLVRKAAAVLLAEIGSLSGEAKQLVAEFEEEDRKLVPVYQPRNKRFDESFPVNIEVAIKEHRPITYSSIGETRVVMDWANRLMVRYGGCTPCYSNECFAFDVGAATWFPIRASDQFCHLFNEVRPNPGCSRGLTFDGRNKLIWVGGGIGGYSGPTHRTHNLQNGLAGYDAALDRFLPCTNASGMAKAYSGEPPKFFAFDSDANLVVSSKSGAMGIGLLDPVSRKTYIKPAPEKMPEMDHYPPPAMSYDPVSKAVVVVHPKLEWKLLFWESQPNTYRVSKAALPGTPNIKICGGLHFDSLNQALILVGGVSREAGAMPTCLYDRQADRWIDLQVKDAGQLGGGDSLTVFDPEHNVFLGLRGGAYRYKNVPVGTKAR